MIKESQVVGRTVAADYNRQTEMADWCRDNFGDGAWGFEILEDTKVQEWYEIPVSTWRWHFSDVHYLELFTKRWPWVDQSTFQVKPDVPLWNRFDEIKAWGVKHSIEVEEVSRYTPFGTFGPTPDSGDFHVLHVRFPETYDRTQFILTWL